MILDGIDIFVEVVDAQSFSRAARRLAMPTSTVSAKVARLEDRLGVTLIRRTTRHLDITPAGRRYYDHCRAALSEMAAAEAELAATRAEPSGQLRLSAAVDMARYKLAPLIASYLERYPKISVDLSITNRRVDMIGDGIDLAIRAGVLTEASLVARRFFTTRLGLFASQDYLARRGTPEAPADLGRHDIIGLSPANALFTLFDGDGQTVALPVAARLRVDDIQTCRTFVENGQGIGVMPDFIGDFAAAPLTRVLPDLNSTGAPVSFLYPTQSFVPTPVRAFIDHAMAGGS